MDTQIDPALKARFVRFCKDFAGLPPLTLEEMLAIWEEEGKKIKELLSGGSKKQYLQWCSEANAKYQLLARQFFVLTPADLFSCLHFRTEDEEWAAFETAQREERVRSVAGFRPSNGDKPASAMYGIMLFVGAEAERNLPPDEDDIALAVPYREISGRSPLATYPENPLLLLEEWKVETIREFYRYLDSSLKNPTQGERLMLGA